MASNLRAMASNLLAMASNLLVMASNLKGNAKKYRASTIYARDQRYPAGPIISKSAVGQFTGKPPKRLQSFKAGDVNKRRYNHVMIGFVQVFGPSKWEFGGLV